MAIVNTSGTLTNATNSTAAQIALTGQAQWLYFSAFARAHIKICGSTASSGVSTALGLAIATGDTYVFQFQPGEAKYLYQVGTAAEPFSIMEVW